MGMFDRIVAEFKCPRCGLFDEHEIQTKDGVRTLKEKKDTFDKFLLKEENDAFWIWNAIGSCHGCGCFFDTGIKLDKTFRIEEIHIYSYRINLKKELVVYPSVENSKRRTK